MIAMAIHCRDKTDCRETIFRDEAAKFLIAEAVRVRGVAVEIQNHRRLLHVLRLDHVQINRVALAPSHLEELQSEIGILGDVGY